MVYLAVCFEARTQQDYYIAAGIIGISMLSDFLDGKIARHFNMITNWGKILDPVADKVTLGVVAVSFSFRYPLMRTVVLIFIFKELFMGASGLLLMRKGWRTGGATWPGKICTAGLYIISFVLLLFPDLKILQVNLLMVLEIGLMFFALVSYIDVYKRQDFGCEGRPQGESVFVKIWAEDAGTGEEIVCRMEEKALWQSGIDEGMQVWMDERGELRRRKLAVFFPGWRHSTDRALLYYPEKLCRNLGYETVLLHYDYPRDRKTENFSFEQTEEQAWKTVQTELDSRKLNDYQEILFVSKSMGTVLAGKAEREYGLTGLRHG